MLAEPTPARKLRTAGWNLPERVVDDEVIQAHDTRLDPAWVSSIIRDLGYAEKTVLVGGNFFDGA